MTGEDRREFLEHLAARGYAARTLLYVGRYYDQFVSFLSRRDIHDVRDVTPSVVDAYHTEARNAVSFYTRKPLAPKTIHMRLWAVRAYFDYLARRRRILVHPARDLGLGRLPEQRPKSILTEQEMERLLHMPDVDAALGVRDKAMMELLYSTGIRGRELIRLNLGDVDFQGSTLTVRQGKGRKDRVVPVGRVALAWLRRYLDEVRGRMPVHDEAFFVDMQYKRRLEQCALTARLVLYARGTDLAGRVTPHAFRHSCATHLLRGGADVRMIQELLGHSDLSTTQIYTRVVPVDLKAAHRRHHPRGGQTN